VADRVNLFNKPTIPTELAGRWEVLVKLAGERLYNKRKKMLEAIGERPYNALPLTDTEVKDRWGKIRRDENALATVLAENVKVTEDGRLLIKNEFLKKAYETEAHFRKGEIAAAEAASANEGDIDNDS
jgi:hypothetical protein